MANVRVPLDERIKQIRAEVDALIDKRVKQIAQECPGVPSSTNDRRRCRRLSVQCIPVALGKASALIGAPDIWR